MNDHARPETLLRMLTEPRRNNYFPLKALDVPQLRLEQDYGKNKQWLLNRLSLGSGVLCGLNVAIDGDKLCVDPGVAIDPLGREVVVPGRFCIDPFAPKPPCEQGWKSPQDDAAAPPKGPATLWLCYRECLTDFVPAGACGCNGEPRCEAGTIVETFKFRITEGKASPPKSDFCETLAKAVKETGDARVALCEVLPDDCAVAEKEICVPLATFAFLDKGGIGELEVCEARRRIYSNAALLELILCLMARIEECCSGDKPKAAPRVRGVEALSAAADEPRAIQPEELAGPPGAVLDASAEIAGLRVAFDAALKPESVVLATGAADIAKASVSVQKVFLSQGAPKRIAVIGLAGGLSADGKTLELKFKNALAPGLYLATLFGSADAANGRQAIVDAAGATALDGEPKGLPSGDGVAGGDFAFFITVQKPSDRSLKVEAVEVLEQASDAPAVLEDPGAGLTVKAGSFPFALRVRFTVAVAPESVRIAASAADAKAASFLISYPSRDGVMQPLPGELTFEDDRTVLFQPARGGFQARDYYLVELFGDKTDARPAISSADGKQRLDGEPLGLPSGDGAEGGTFAFKLNVTE